MTLIQSLQNLSNNASYMTPALMGSVDIDLLRSIQIRGDFPTSLNLLNKIEERLKADEATPEQVASMVCVDQVLALRLISIANFEHYHQGKAVSLVSESVNHLGLWKAGEIIENLADAKNLNAVYLGRAVSLTMMQQTIIASVIARKLAELIFPKKDLSEQAYVTNVLSNLGPLLLAFYKPHLYSGLCLDCMDNRDLFERGFKKVMRKSLGEFAIDVVRTLSLPKEYEHLVSFLDTPPWKNKNWGRQNKQEREAIVTAAYTANLLAHEICYFTGIQGVQGLIRQLESEADINPAFLEDCVGTVADVYLNHTETLELKPVRVPEYLSWFDAASNVDGPARWLSALPGINERINPFLYELRACFKKQTEPDDFYFLPQAVHLTLSAMIKGLNFDRAVFFRTDTKGSQLQLCLCLGVKLFEPERIRRPLNKEAGQGLPEVTAFYERKAVFEGDPIFADGWPFVAFPAIWRNEVVGVFYADKVRRPEGDALNSQEQIACIALAEEWHDIPVDFY